MWQGKLLGHHEVVLVPRRTAEAPGWRNHCRVGRTRGPSIVAVTEVMISLNRDDIYVIVLGGPLRGEVFELSARRRGSAPGERRALPS